MELPIQTILGAAIPVFALLLIGLILRRTNVLTKEADVSIMKLVVRVFYPCLFLDFLIGNPAVKEAPNLLAAPLVGFLTTVAGFLAGYGIAKLIGLEKGKGLRTFAFCNGIYNYGYIPIPLIIALFGDRETLGVLLVHNVGVEVAIWTAGIILISGQFHRGTIKQLFNPPLIALLVSLMINSSGMDSEMPEPLLRLISMLGACSIPVGILLAGAAIADLLKNKGVLENFKIPVASILLRLGLLPMVFLVVAATLPGLSTELRQVILIQAAMPAGILPIVLARHYGGEASVAVKVVISTTLASVITMPLWIQFGAWFVF
ncbi:AEC family transporter [Puniceicoccales bacterium CK1056]|uniref:AEC family transporter n=1 Tax=Oceanipulchritudo coccoides TaxID=2706888 RepID=A0A6B2M0C1_9BACT|nr:AEC family transporter [Oceanipulchritudo coccoides]NDV62153.1 AEC family transporter [Oceanipulchritudo coccoides]